MTMYKINPPSVGESAWWGPICKLTCNNWPIMKPTPDNATLSGAADIITSTCNHTTFYSHHDSIDAEHQFSYLLALLFGVPATLIIIVTVFGNFLVLCFKAKVGKRQTMLLIWNLGLADFLVGVFVLPIGVSYVIGRKWPFSRLLCRIWVSCDVIFCTASIVTLCVISVDRYIGVTRPLRYKLIVTKTKVMISIMAIWVFSISILLATIRYHTGDEDCYDPTICHAGNELEYVVHSVVFAFFLPTLVTLVLYWKIYIVAKRRERGLAQGLILAMGQNFFKECFAVPLRIHCGKDTMSQQQQVIRMHKKVAKTLGVVVSAFVICWGPFFSLYIIGYKCGGCIPSLVLDITSWLGYCNSMINPVIYAFTVDEFKRTLKVLFCPFWHRHVAAQAEPTGGRLTQHTRSVYAPASRLPRSSRAYSLVPAAEEHVLSLLSPFLRRPTACERSSTPSQGADGASTKDEGAKKVSISIRKRLSGRSKKSVSMQTISAKDQAKRAPSIVRSRTEGEEIGLISVEATRHPAFMGNGTATNSIEHIDMDESSEVDQWNAKLYCTLISSQSTGL